jgi:UDP-glucose 4-epimerase
VLVTGASGFLGSHVVSQLVAAGVEVVGVSLRGGEVAGVRVEPLDLTERSAALSALATIDCDAVVHLAAVLPVDGSPEAMQEAFDGTVAIDATLSVFCRRRGCRLVYVSGSSVYGSIADRTPATEERLPQPENLYAVAKCVGDILYLEQARETGVPVAVLRLSAPYGPGARRPTVVETFLRAALVSSDLKLLGSGARTQDFTFVRDAAEATVRALERRASGAFNISTGAPVSMRQLAESVLAAVPASHSRIGLAGTSDPQEGYRALLDVAKARAELDWVARTPLLDGLRQTAAWLEAVS